MDSLESSGSEIFFFDFGPHIERMELLEQVECTLNILSGYMELLVHSHLHFFPEAFRLSLMWSLLIYGCGLDNIVQATTLIADDAF